MKSGTGTYKCASSPDQSADEPNQEANTVPLLPQTSCGASKSSLYEELRHFRISLKWCALDHSTCAGKFISYSTFALLTFVVPISGSLAVHVPAGDPFHLNNLVHVPESVLATIAFFTLSRFFTTYGLWQLLFLDGLENDLPYVRRGYTRELDKAFRYLACILLPSFLLQLVHKIVFFSTVVVSVPHLSKGVPVNSMVFLLALASWVYRTGVFLLVCMLFRLTCELQILRFEEIHKMFEGHGSDGGVIFEEHLRIRKQLSATSHRYRFFIIGCLVTITVSQLGALLLVLGSKTKKTFFNSGDIVICSAVQLSGLFLCLIGAARITHRAQGIVSVATRWNMLVTCASSSSTPPPNHHKAALSAAEPVSNHTDENDKFNLSENCIAVCSQDPSCFQTRQALVSYLQHNNGGITLFGFALDRGLLHTLFAFETSLVLWILSKVVVLS